MKYVPDRKGTLELAQSEPVGRACATAGQAVVDAAKAVPVPGFSGRQVESYRSAFGVKRADVTMKSGERRAGAIVYNDHELEHVFGGRSRALYSAIQALDGVSVR